MISARSQRRGPITRRPGSVEHTFLWCRVQRDARRHDLLEHIIFAVLLEQLGNVSLDVGALISLLLLQVVDIAGQLIAQLLEGAVDEERVGGRRHDDLEHWRWSVQNAAGFCAKRNFPFARDGFASELRTAKRRRPGIHPHHVNPTRAASHISSIIVKYYAEGLNYSTAEMQWERIVGETSITPESTASVFGLLTCSDLLRVDSFCS